MYLRFRTFYYQILVNESSFQLNSFLKDFTLVTIDYSRQNEFVKSGTVRLEFEFKENVPANTITYLASSYTIEYIHTYMIEYSPMLT